MGFGVGLPMTLPDYGQYSTSHMEHSFVQHNKAFKWQSMYRSLDREAKNMTTALRVLGIS